MSTSIPKELISTIDATVFKSLFRTKPHIHALAMCSNWMIILLVIYLYLKLSMLWLYPIAVVLIGARMHALTVLMHDAAHYRFLKNRQWNDLLSNLFIMYPIFTSIEKYRTNHLKHHQHLNTEHDPDWVAKLTKREFHFPKTKREFLLTLSSYMVFYQGILDALWFVQRYRDANKDKVKMEDRISKTIFYVVLFCLLSLCGLWKLYLLFWIVPYLTSFFMFQYIRSVAEHYGEMEHEDCLSSSRTVIAGMFERFLIAPHQVNYHLEHHLYPGVPFYNLPQLHKLLIVQIQYKENAHITKGYITGLLKELGSEC